MAKSALFSLELSVSGWCSVESVKKPINELLRSFSGYIILHRLAHPLMLELHQTLLLDAVEVDHNQPLINQPIINRLSDNYKLI